MTVPVWPTTLPKDLLQRGYGQSSPDVVIRSNMDVGPAKSRRRATAGVMPVTGRLILTLTELGYIRTFHDTTLLGGSLRFTWKDPISRVSKELRFTAPIKWQVTNGLYDVALEMEILP